MRRAFRLGLRCAHIEREVDDEIGFHLEMRTQRLMANGRSPSPSRSSPPALSLPRSSPPPAPPEWRRWWR